MFEKLTTLNALDLSKFLKWKSEDINELLNKPKLEEEDVYNFYTNKLRMKKVFQTPDNLMIPSAEKKLYNKCDVCKLTINKKLITNVEGTYKYTHCKYNSTTYRMCPVCLYVSANNKKYANLASEINTYDNQGIVDCRPSSDDLKSNWVIVHPQLLNRNDARNKCGCDFGCYMCNIDPRFTFENK